MGETPEWTDLDLSVTEGANGVGPAMPARLKLVVLSGADRGKELVLTHGTYIVGKHPRCALVMSDDRVSRKHLELRIGADGVQVRDLGSRNGSFFKGARFTTITVGTGAVLALGDSELTLLSDAAQAPILPSEKHAFGGLRGRALVMRQLFALLERVTPSDAGVLIEGETGTGKELCAEAIHAASARAAGPFVVCDLSAVARNLLESELFGHGKGAFTGADKEREGAFEAANGGTLFLDEIGELEPELQPRLLRAIERRQVCRVGETRHRTVDLRVVAATNRDLAEEVKAGRFREDLYHRLSVVPVRLPPLRERKEDLPLLVEAILDGKSVSVLPETLALLGEYDWPGNVRELGNVLQRGLAMLAPGEPLAPSHLGFSAEARGPNEGPPDFHLAKEKLIEAWERDFLAKLLKTNGDNLSQAARQTGLGRAHLYRLLKKYKLD